MIGYYVHHHGSGHLNRATSICAQLRHPAVALTSLDIPRHPFATVLRLPRDDGDPRPAEPSANGALHWVPHHDDGLRARLALIARWIDATRPAAIVVDVSVEVALFVRLLDVPVIVMAMPGDRTDAPHASVHQIADHIIAAWPRELYEPDWLRAYAAKTSYVGGISRFVGHQVLQPTTNRAPTVLFLSGTGGCDFDQSTVDATAGLLSEIRWTTLGLRGGPRTCDPWPDICAADVVITHAGQSCVADVATARRPAIVLPQARPFNEQHATAETLRRHRLAVTSDGWPDGRAWRRLIRQARGADPSSWERWRTTGAAARAAEAIDATARQYAGNVMRTAVITTVNGRTQHLRRQLVGLSCSARLPDAHVIVAIGDPAVPDVVAASGTTADVVHCEGLPGPLPVASARNIGALTALNDGAELLVFVDVDCIPGRNLLGRYHEAVVDPEHRDALLCGPVTYLPPPRGADGYPIALEPMINPHPARPAPPDGDTVSSTDYELFWSLSFALTASTWRRIGGFCDRYRGYGAEDTDFAQTARAASVPMRWVGGAHAFHQFHSVSDPPAEHLHDIVRNAMVFHQRWGWWPMSNWLDAFEQRPNRISKEHGPVEIWTLFAPSPGASQHQGYR